MSIRSTFVKLENSSLERCRSWLLLTYNFFSFFGKVAPDCSIVNVGSSLYDKSSVSSSVKLNKTSSLEIEIEIEIKI